MFNYRRQKTEHFTRGSSFSDLCLSAVEGYTPVFVHHHTVIIIFFAALYFSTWYSCVWQWNDSHTTASVTSFFTHTEDAASPVEKCKYSFYFVMCSKVCGWNPISHLALCSFSFFKIKHFFSSLPMKNHTPLPTLYVVWCHWCDNILLLANAILLIR